MNLCRDGMLYQRAGVRCRTAVGTLSAGLILAAAAALCGCQDYYSTGPRVGPYDYDIHRFNRLTQEAEPGSPNRWRTFIAADGGRSVAVYEKYRSGSGKASSSRGSQQSSGAANSGQAGGYSATK